MRAGWTACGVCTIGSTRRPRGATSQKASGGVATTNTTHAGRFFTGESSNDPGSMLKNKVAVIYGAGGAIGSAVARAFAREGAKVFLTGRKRAPVEAV